jgi:hypothetical protein
VHRLRHLAATPRRGAQCRGWLRPLVAAGVLGALVWRLGTGPFVAGVGRVDVLSLAAAGGVAVVTTLCCAWRWTLVADRLGVALPLRTAVAAYYRSQFLNLTTPGGVLGDVDRAVRHGRAAGDRRRSVRSVVWERIAGQAVLVAGAACALALLPSPVRHSVRALGVVLAAATVTFVLAVWMLHRWLPPGQLLNQAAGRMRVIRRARAELRTVLLARHTGWRILLASAVAACGHVVTFLVAARTAGAAAAPSTVLPLALVVLLAMGLPNVAGWGPREGMAAWAFGAGGLGPQVGVTTAVVYGVMVLVGALPGALLLVAAGLQRAREVGHG